MLGSLKNVPMQTGFFVFLSIQLFHLQLFFQSLGIFPSCLVSYKTQSSAVHLKPQQPYGFLPPHLKSQQKNFVNSTLQKSPMNFYCDATQFRVENCWVRYIDLYNASVHWAVSLCFIMMTLWSHCATSFTWILLFINNVLISLFRLALSALTINLFLFVIGANS